MTTTYPMRSTAEVWTGAAYAKDVDGLLTNGQIHSTEPDFIPDRTGSKAKRVVVFPIAGTNTWKARTGPIGMFRFSDLLTEPAPAGYSMISAIPQDAARVRVKFGTAITAVSSTGVNDALNPHNYDVTPGYLAIQSISSVSADTVDIIMNAPLGAQSYSIRVHGIVALSGLFPNAIGGADTLTFTGTPVLPTILSVVGTPDTNSVQIVYSKPMDRASATNPANYSVSAGVTVVSVLAISDTIFVLTTSGETAGSSYTLTCSSNIKDQFGNSLT